MDLSKIDGILYVLSYDKDVKANKNKIFSKNFLKFYSKSEVCNSQFPKSLKCSPILNIITERINFILIDEYTPYPMNKTRFQDIKHTNTYKLNTLGTID